MTRHLLTLSIGAGLAAALTFGGCGDAPTQETESIEPVVLEALATQVVRGIKGLPNPDDLAGGLDGGSVGFGSGAATAGNFDGSASTTDDFGGDGGTTVDFDSDAGTTEVVGGGFPYGLNFTNMLQLAGYEALHSNPYANGIAVFSPGSTNEISWQDRGTSGMYEVEHLAIEFTRDGSYVGDLDSGSTTVTGTRFEYEAPSTSNLVIVIFIVFPVDGGLFSDVQWGFAFVGSPF